MAREIEEHRQIQRNEKVKKEARREGEKCREVLQYYHKWLKRKDT